jgi:hypothetical protein
VPINESLSVLKNVMAWLNLRRSMTEYVWRGRL